MELGSIDGKGVLAGAMQIHSPNFDERPEGAALTLIVVHNISLPPGDLGGDAIIRLFTNTLDYAGHPYYESLRELKVSTHFLILRGGQLVQFVPCAKRAWHAGPSSWRGRERCNDFSIGVELVGTDDQPYAEEQYLSLSQLTSVLRRHYPLVDLVGHADIAPGRKTDPGPAFDWGQYRALLAPNPTTYERPR